MGCDLSFRNRFPVNDVVAGRGLAARMLRGLDLARSEHALQTRSQRPNSRRQCAAGIVPGPAQGRKYGVLQIADALAEQRDWIVEPLQLFHLQAAFLTPELQ